MEGARGGKGQGLDLRGKGNFYQLGGARKNLPPHAPSKAHGHQKKESTI